MKKSFLSLCVAMIASAAFIFTGCSDDKEQTPKAPTVEIVEIVGQTRQSAVVKYIATGDNLTASGIRYADSEAGIATGTELTGTDGVVEITGLVQNKTYYVQAFASSAAGNAYSAIISFTTEAIQSPTAEIVEIVDQTRQSAVVKYSITGDNLTASGIRYADSEAGVATGIELTGTDGVVEITGLVQNKTYYVQAFASNAAGNAYSEVVSFSTDGPKAVMTFLDMGKLLAYITAYDDPEVEVETLEIGGQPEGADCDVIAGLGGEGNRFPSLKALVFSEATIIDKKAFNSSNNSASIWLTEFSAPKALTIKEEAFKGCGSLKLINFPKVLTVEKNAFAGATGLTEITSEQFPVINSVGQMAFSNDKLIKFELPSLTSLNPDTYILYAAPKLKSVKLGLTEISYTICGLMQYCPELEEITAESFPHVTKLGSSAFTWCEKLAKVHFSKVTEIGSSPLSGCNKLVKLRFDSDLSSIDADAFKGFDASKCDLYITAKTAQSAVDKVWHGVTWKSINII